MFASWLLCLFGVMRMLDAQSSNDPCPDPYPEPEPNLYKGYRVLEATITSAEKKRKLLHIVNEFDVDLWRPPRNDRDTADLFVCPQMVSRVMGALRVLAIPVEITPYNITQAILNERARIRRRTIREALHIRPVVTFSLDDFNTYSEILYKLTDWVESCPNGMRCRLTKIGKTHQGRDIKMITLGAHPPSPNKKAIYIDSLTHAREWITGSTSLYIINKLITGWQTNVLVTQLLLKYDFIFVPVVNPDGYVYSWGPDRLWRKNREPNQGSNCVGTDINRNFKSKWCSIPVSPSGSNNPCSQVFCGPEAGSSKEAKAIMKLMKSNELWFFLGGQLQILNFASQKLLLSVSIHSYGKMWLFPWGHRKNGACHLSQFNTELTAAANAARIASQNAEGDDLGSWVSGTICSTIYAAPGNTCDFVHKRGCKHSYTPELRGSSFVIPNTQIDEAANEAWQGILAIINVID